jgi:hypothetical protein
MSIRRWVTVLIVCLVPAVAAADELKPETVAAYEKYTGEFEKAFVRTEGTLWLEGLSADQRARLRKGEVLAWPGSGDGILSVPDGLIHHWRAMGFIPDVTLARVLTVAQDYETYARTYDYIVGAAVLDRTPLGDPRGERFRTLLRIQRTASVVTSTVDLWAVIDYRYPHAGRAIAISDADCVRQVEHPGTSREHRLPVGQGSGYLWRANTYSSYAEGDGGVYIDLHSIGLSRGFPPLLGWIVEPIARRLGRGAGMSALNQLRHAVAGKPAVRDAPPAQKLPQAGWCGEP